MRHSFTLAFLTLLCTRPDLARANAPVRGHLEFIENRGQWDGRVRYAARVAPGAQLFAEAGALTYALSGGLPDHNHSGAAEPKFPVSTGLFSAHGLRVEFGNATAGVAPTAEQPAAGAHSYLRGTAPGAWAASARAWQQLRYRQLWPGTDLILKESTGHELEYDLLLAPGADAGRPTLRYRGAQSLRLDPATGSLRVQTSVGELRELRPQAWQQDPATGVRQPVSCAFRLRGEEVSFQLGSYDHRRPLVIDPVVQFASYTGSAVENWGFASTYDPQGNLYTAGIVFALGYPATTGAYQTTFAGSTDIALMKFNTTQTGPGARAWATYLGGNGFDFPHSLLVNRRGELLLLGSTSSTDYPTSASALSRQFQGGTAISPYGASAVFQLTRGTDLVLSRLSASGGSLLNSTYLGGSGNDGVLDGSAPAPRLRYNWGDAFRGDLALDPQGNVYVGTVSSSANFPGLPTGFYRGGSSDGIVTSLDSTLSRVRWTVAVGGSGADAVYSLQREEPAGTLLVAGGTTSPNLSSSSSGYRAALAGGVDGFVARVSDAGVLTQASYLGTSGYDQAFFARQGPGGKVYVLGQTIGPAWPGLSTDRYYIPKGQQFIQELMPDLRGAGFATVFGSGSATPDSLKTNLSPTAFYVDCYGRMMLAGWGGPLNPDGSSTTGLPVTSNALQRSGDGKDFYLMQLSDGALQLDYGSFYGSSADDHCDGGTSHFDERGVLYQALCANSQGGVGIPIPPGATYYTPTSGSPDYNNAAFKLDFLAKTSPAGPDSVTVCARGAAIRLAGSPMGGTWTGTGVTGSVTTGFTFQPDTTRLGTFQLTYTGPPGGACTGSGVRYVTVKPQRRAKLTTPIKVICLVPGQPAPLPIPLTMSPTGGVLTGVGILPGTNLFDPAKAGRGSHQLTYVIDGGSTCPARATVTIVVKGLLKLKPRLPLTVCSNDPPQPLEGQPAGGYWTGNGVLGTVISGFTFNPSPQLVGNHLLLYTFPGDADCPPIVDSLRVQVRPTKGKVTLPADTSMCLTGARFRLTRATPPGGTWAGPGVSGSDTTGYWFTPTPALSGAQTLTYTAPRTDPDTCPPQGRRVVTLRSDPVRLTLADTVLCATAGPQPLTAIPTGGTWSGPGVSGSAASGYFFTPTARLEGRQTLTYFAPPPSSSQDCPGAGQLKVKVLPVPNMLFTPLDPINICRTAPPHGVVLSATPPNGTFSGPGVTGNRFNPSEAGPGRHVLTYTWPFPGLNCPVVATQVVEVRLVPEVELPADTVLCGDLSPFQLRAAPAGGTWTGPGVTPEGLFTPPLGPGSTELTYALPGGCAGKAFSVTVADQLTFGAKWQSTGCADNTLAPRVVRFRAGGPLAAQVRWDFGDGSSATGATVEHTYAAGSFQPKASLPAGVGPSSGPCARELALSPINVQSSSIPNIITPDGDGKNDTFAPRVGGCQLRLQVFSRWGQEVFDQENYQNDWGAQNQPAGLYYYLLSAPDGGQRVKGWVEVVR